MNVVSIDPAPSKDAVIFDGQMQYIQASEVPALCHGLSQKTDTLLCWDAPLTGPSLNNEIEALAGCFSQRQIEQFFSRNETGFKAPYGISVVPYSGCPHWAITRASIGLPICGKFDRSIEELPFRLLTDTVEIRPDIPQVIETHPAVAIWLWCRGVGDEDDTRPWVYKGRRPTRTISEIWVMLSGVWATTQVPEVVNTINNIEPPTNDDELDAIVGWVLGQFLVCRHPSVGILGTYSTGAIALPIDDELRTSFSTFLQRNAR
jgi:hypothetical protein